MEIDKLPVEILMKIFSYLPSYAKVSLVNKQFYNVACKVNDSNVCLSLRLSEKNEERKRNLQLFQSIRNTNRKITKLSIHFSHLTTEKEIQSTISIIRKFSEFIKYLNLVSYALEMFNFLEILSLVPNVEHLVFECLSVFRIEKQPSRKKRRVVPSNEDLNLHQLKTLQLHNCKEKFSVVFNRLPAGVLTELKLHVLNLEALTILFKRQTNIKKLKLDGYYKEKYVPTIRADIENILPKQSKLKFLTLRGEVTNDVIMNVVAHQLTELETLKLDVSNISVETFVNIRKLKKLQNLTLLSDNTLGNSNKFESFAKLNNSGITILDIRGIKQISVDFIGALAKSVPNLKIFRVNFYTDRIFNAITKNFNFVEVLLINHDCPNETYDTNNLILDECVNTKLIELYMVYPLLYETQFLNKLITNYPNLKKLVVRSYTPLTTSQFKLILNGFTKIESLVLFGASQLTIDDLACLKDHKKNLKFIAFTDLKFELNSHKKMLSTIFDVVSVEGHEYLAMSVDRATMKGEKPWF